ncbi:hypothetical protein REPUB_Repub13aG0053400 [Reevesia pubescens]
MSTFFTLCDQLLILNIPPQRQWNKHDLTHYTFSGSNISRPVKKLAEEFGAASNIKSRVNRQSVQEAITSAQQRLKLYRDVPPNGLVLYTGTVVTDDWKEKKFTYDLVPFKPLKSSLYLCDNKFLTEALKELLESDEKFGFLIVDGHGTLFGTPNKRRNYLRKAAELATKHFIDPRTNQPNVIGLILAGSADLKTDLSQSLFFDSRLKGKILKLIDISYGGESSFNQAIELSIDVLANMKFIQQKRLLGKGVIETLIVWENLEINPYILKNSITNEVVIKQLNKEQEVEQSNFQDPATASQLDIQEKMALLEWLANNYQRFGCLLEIATDCSQEGYQFCRGFGGVGGILQYKHDITLFDDDEIYEDSE